MKLASYLLTTLFLLAFSALSQAAPSLLVSPETSDALDRLTKRDFASVGTYWLGDSSNYLLTIDEKRDRKAKLFGGVKRSTTIELTLIDTRGKAVAKTSAKEKSYNRALASAYKTLIKDAKKTLGGLDSNRGERNWLALYQSVYVARVINNAAHSTASNTIAKQAAASLGHTVASRPAAITVAQYEACQLELSLGAIVSSTATSACKNMSSSKSLRVNKPITDAANYQDLMHHYISIGDIEAVKKMLPFLDQYGGNVPLFSNIEYYEQDSIFGASAGNSFIHTAAFSGNEAMFNLILELDNDLTQTNTDGFTPAHIAAASKKFGLLKVIADKSPETVKPLVHDTLVWMVLDYTGLEQQLPAYHDRQLLTSDLTMDSASVHGYLDWLREMGADLNGEWKGGGSAFEAAVYGNKPELLEYVVDNGGSLKGDEQALLQSAMNSQSVHTVKTLINLGAKPSSKHLKQAVLMRDREITEELLATGLDINSQDSTGKGVLHFAYPDGSSEVEPQSDGFIQFLISKGADPYQMDYSGQTAYGAYRVSREKYFADLAEQRMLAALERERQMKIAEQRRREAARRAAQQQAEQKNGFQWAKAAAMGAGFLAGGGLDMDSAAQAEMIVGIVGDSMPGVDGIGNFSQAVNDSVARANARSNSSASPSVRGYKQSAPMPKMHCPSSADGQLSSMCKAADVYYDRYRQLHLEHGPEVAAEMYQAYQMQAQQAQDWANATNAAGTQQNQAMGSATSSGNTTLGSSEPYQRPAATPCKKSASHASCVIRQ